MSLDNIFVSRWFEAAPQEAAKVCFVSFLSIFFFGRGRRDFLKTQSLHYIVILLKMVNIFLHSSHYDT